MAAFHRETSPVARSLLLEALRQANGTTPLGDMALALLGDSSEPPEVRAAAARLLPGHTAGGPAVTAVLASALSDENIDVVASAAWAAARAVPSRAEDLLNPLLNDERRLPGGETLGAWIKSQLHEVRSRRHDPMP